VPTRPTLRLDNRSPMRPESVAGPLGLRLLDTFEVAVAGVPRRLPGSAQRVVVFVALHERPLLRSYVAGSLWLDVREERAAASLRSALWRVQRTAPGLIEADAGTLRLGAGVCVDFREVEQGARAELDGAGGVLERATLARDLLPDWYDDWVLLERERFRQLRLRALDALAQRLMREGRLGEALDAALVALAGEPLRESAHRTLVSIHLEDGNAGEAVRQFRLCRRLLREQLGIDPSERMLDLVAGLDSLETNG
jgi:DNA-binding SARP family transcriptional activator